MYEGNLWLACVICEVGVGLLPCYYLCFRAPGMLVLSVPGVICEHVGNSGLVCDLCRGPCSNHKS
jgi:hypothetical protein